MKKRIFLLLILSSLLFATSPNEKSNYDIIIESLEKSTNSKSANSTETKVISNNQTETTLTLGGYFTIGTVSGNSMELLDDNCSITFGHPFAKTSYPVFSIDGIWYKPDEYFSDPMLLLPEIIEDTILFEAADDLLEIQFKIYMTTENTIEIITNITNLDGNSHTFGSGLIIDPSLGKWGDGYLLIDDSFHENCAEFTSISNDQVYSLWEKSKGAKGIGLDLSFKDNPPDKMMLANWAELYDNRSPDFKINENQKLYDMVIQSFWSEQIVESQKTINNQTTLQLVTPDFSSDIFMRWDMPNFLSMDNGLMFPRELNTYFELMKTNEASQFSGSLEFLLPDRIESTVESYNINYSGNNPYYQNIKFQTGISYEDIIVEVTSQLKSGEDVIDEISRNLYIPKTPVSDTGLVITGDSIITSDYPEVSLIFNIENNTTGQKITSLKTENIFLYENEIRVSDYNLGFFEVQGSNLADVVFVLDCSGSMGDEIEAVKSNIGEFADSLVSQGYDFQIGVITFSTTVDEVWDFSNDVDQIKTNLANVDTWGGVEDSPAALYRASELSWRSGSKRTIVWVTDEPYPEHSYTKQDIVNKMLSMEIKVHGIGATNLQTDWFNPIIEPTGGNFYDINGNFKDILIDITNLGGQFKYQISYESKNPNNDINQIYLKIYYGGLGAQSIFDYNVPLGKSKPLNILSCFPNPFNERITFQLNLENHKKTKMMVYNIQGKKIQEYNFDSTKDYYQVFWDGRNINGQNVSTGLYVICLTAFDNSGQLYKETQKILFLK